MGDNKDCLGERDERDKTNEKKNEQATKQNWGPHGVTILKECFWVSLIGEMQAHMCASDKSRREGETDREGMNFTVELTISTSPRHSCYPLIKCIDSSVICHNSL